VWLKSGASKRRHVPLTKCSLTVATPQQSWRNGNHYSASLMIPPFAPTSISLEHVGTPENYNLKVIIRRIARGGFAPAAARQRRQFQQQASAAQDRK
jgi:hypothetical protein